MYRWIFKQIINRRCFYGFIKKIPFLTFEKVRMHIYFRFYICKKKLDLSLKGFKKSTNKSFVYKTMIVTLIYDFFQCMPGRVKFSSTIDATEMKTSIGLYVLEHFLNTTDIFLFDRNGPGLEV